MASPADHPEDPDRRQSASPSPVRPKRQVTFEDPKDTEVKWTSPTATPNRQNLEAAGSRLQSWAEAPDDLGHPPELDPCVTEFLSRTGLLGGGGDDSDQSSMPKPSFSDPQEWVRWHACGVETLTWWQELVAVPQRGDI